MPEDVTTTAMSQADAEMLQRQTCKWLGFATVALCIAIVGKAYLMAGDLRFDFWHNLITAGLLLWGWRGGGAALQLATFAVAIGMVYVAPVIFFAGLLWWVPEENLGDREQLPLGLVYFGVLLVYYGVALAFMRRANGKAKDALLRRD